MSKVGAASPLSARRLIADEDEYRGYRLLQGTAIVINTRHEKNIGLGYNNKTYQECLRSEKNYPEPFRFNLERFSGHGEERGGTRQNKANNTDEIP